MIRSLFTVLLCFAAIVTGDTLFRTSLLSHLHPVMLSPAKQAVLRPPVLVQWDGPQPMRVVLSVTGEAPRDLGVRSSPVTLEADSFPRDGGYQVDVESPTFGSWVHASRRFQVHAGPGEVAAAAQPAESDHKSESGWDVKDLLRALEAARTARDRAHSRTKFLTEENGALRDESERLAKQLEALYDGQEEDAQHTGDLERRVTQLTDENHALADELAALRQRLSAVVPCSVWGYFAYLHPNTIPPSRRVLLVTDGRGQILRSQQDCELLRRGDRDSASVCFCVGNTWGG